MCKRLWRISKRQKPPIHLLPKMWLRLHGRKNKRRILNSKKQSQTNKERIHPAKSNPRCDLMEEEWTEQDEATYRPLRRKRLRIQAKRRRDKTRKHKYSPRLTTREKKSNSQ